MRLSTRLAISAAWVTLGLAGRAIAQDQPVPPAPPPQPPPSGLSVDSPVADLLANPGALAVLNKDLPGLTTDSHLEMIKPMSLRQIAQFPQAHLDDDKLKAIQADLDAANPPVAGSAPASAPATAEPPMSPAAAPPTSPQAPD
jgi:hypothetical protein